MAELLKKCRGDEYIMGKLFGFLLCSVSPLVLVKQAYAYIDPGTGSMLVQALLAVVAVVSVSIGIFWQRFRSFLSRIFNRKNSNRYDADDR